MPAIINGLFKGLKLTAPKGQLTRPTSAKVREAVFSILGPAKILEARVLDLLAGSGALGLEAVSRGAKSALLCDRSPMAVSTLRQNMGKIPPEAQEKIKPLKASFPQCFSVLSRYGPFDLIFLDPPYADRLLPVQFLTFAASQRLAAPGATVIWEQDANFIKNIDPSQFLPWRLTSFRRWGGTGAAFLEFPAQFSPEEQPSEPAEPAIEAET